MAITLTWPNSAKDSAKNSAKNSAKGQRKKDNQRRSFGPGQMILWTWLKAQRVIWTIGLALHGHHLDLAKGTPFAPTPPVGFGAKGDTKESWPNDPLDLVK